MVIQCFASTVRCRCHKRRNPPIVAIPFELDRSAYRAVVGKSTKYNTDVRTDRSGHLDTTIQNV